MTAPQPPSAKWCPPKPRRSSSCAKNIPRSTWWRRCSSIAEEGVVTGGGVCLCIDTTLHLLADMLERHIAEETARIMEYTRARQANRDGFAPLVVTRR